MLEVKVSKKDDRFSWYVNEFNWNDYNYTKQMNDLVEEYFNNNEEVNEETKDSIKSKVNNLDNQIIELIKQKVIHEANLKFIETAEKIKKNNIEISNYINSLKQNNKLNKWYSYVDGKKYEVIENGSYKLSIRHSGLEKSWKNDKEYFEVEYTFLFNNILSNTIIKCVTKKIKTQEELEKYIEGRKNAFEKYFKEEKPAILNEYSESVDRNNLRLMGYRLESESISN